MRPPWNAIKRALTINVTWSKVHVRLHISIDSFVPSHIHLLVFKPFIFYPYLIILEKCTCSVIDQFWSSTFIHPLLPGSFIHKFYGNLLVQTFIHSLFRSIFVDCIEQLIDWLTWWTLFSRNLPLFFWSCYLHNFTRRNNQFISRLIRNSSLGSIHTWDLLRDFSVGRGDYCCCLDRAVGAITKNGCTTHCWTFQSKQKLTK